MAGINIEQEIKILGNVWENSYLHQHYESIEVIENRKKEILGLLLVLFFGLFGAIVVAFLPADEKPERERERECSSAEYVLLNTGKNCWVLKLFVKEKSAADVSALSLLIGYDFAA